MAESNSEPRIEVNSTPFTTLFDKDSEHICVKPSPLPGIVIFVHGVNSEGEWFTAAEEGLCKGLNRRIGRLDDQVEHPHGQLTPAQYIESLTADGYLNPDMSAGSYVKPDPSFSPVIHFRWGYKANKEELKLYGDKIMLNEQNYWGGGPFANGCSSLPDLWNEGLNDRLFLWITIQHLNSVNARKVYGTPPRFYGVLAALRLAKLIESIRRKQADTPITVVCHSQGNMVGIAAAFLGDRLAEVTDHWGKSGRCVADTYVLCNPPYSLVAELGTDNWAQRGVKDGSGHVGRQSFEARKETLKAYFNILRERAGLEPDAADVDREMANTRTSESGGKPFNAAADREAHGLNGNTYGRVTLYACPHDQVISATTVQGMGWRGLSQPEIDATGGEGVLTQRVFASGFTVGENKPYRYWEDDWRYGKGKTPGFWYPPSPTAKFALGRALRSNERLIPKVMTTITAPALYLFNFTSVAVNADPPKGWVVPVSAPPLEEAIRFVPQAIRYGKVSKLKDGDAESEFNENYDPPAAARDGSKQEKQEDDPYDKFADKRDGQQAQGNLQSEAAQRYEDHAILRMEARRDKHKGWVDADGNVTGEDSPESASDDYKQWHNEQVTDILKEGINNNPTNHSTIMTNPAHAEKALAYDVAIGPCYLSVEELRELRIEADWRFVDGLDKTHPSKKFAQYFVQGKQQNEFLQNWVKKDSDAHMPNKIKDQRDGGFMLKVGDFLS